MSDRFDGPPAASLGRLLSDEEMEFTPPSRALRGISWQVASARPGGSVHSISDVLAHMRFWQQRLLDMAAGRPPHPVPTADVGWPGVNQVGWQALVDAYLAGFDKLREHASDGELLRRPIRPDHPNTVGFQIASHFAHEAHHLGQIILLRRQLGSWPPEGGGDSW